MIESNSTNESVHSDEIQDIITAIPSWITRWGTFLCVLFLLMAIIMSTFIQSTQFVNIDLKVNTRSISYDVKYDGIVDSLWVEDGETVMKGQTIITIKGTDSVSRNIIALRNGKINYIAVVKPTSYLKSGQNIFIIQEDPMTKYAITHFTEEKSTLIKLGQLVKIEGSNPKSDNIITGIVSFVTTEPDEKGNYEARIDFLNSFSKQLSGKTLKGKVVVSRETIFNRFFNRLIRGFNNYSEFQTKN